MLKIIFWLLISFLLTKIPFWEGFFQGSARFFFTGTLTHTIRLLMVFLHLQPRARAGFFLQTSRVLILLISPFLPWNVIGLVLLALTALHLLIARAYRETLEGAYPLLPATDPAPDYSYTIVVSRRFSDARLQEEYHTVIKPLLASMGRVLEVAYASDDVAHSAFWIYQIGTLFQLADVMLILGDLPSPATTLEQDMSRQYWRGRYNYLLQIMFPQADAVATYDLRKWRIYLRSRGPAFAGSLGQRYAYIRLDRENAYQNCTQSLSRVLTTFKNAQLRYIQSSIEKNGDHFRKFLAQRQEILDIFSDPDAKRDHFATLQKDAGLQAEIVRVNQFFQLNLNGWNPRAPFPSWREIWDGIQELDFFKPLRVFMVPALAGEYVYTRLLIRLRDHFNRKESRHP